MAALLAQPKFADERQIAVGVPALEVVKQLATAADHAQQPTAAVMVLGVLLEMRRQLIDARRQQRRAVKESA